MKWKRRQKKSWGTPVGMCFLMEELVQYSIEEVIFSPNVE